MMTREELVSGDLMQMSPLDQIADICPKCFGPTIDEKNANEPDYILCMDGNFQHRRHIAASNELFESQGNLQLFISPSEVENMKSMVNEEGSEGVDASLVRMACGIIERQLTDFQISNTIGPMYRAAYCSQ